MISLLIKAGADPNTLDKSGVALSSFSLYAASAFCSEERVLSAATFRTIPPLNPVRPACCDP
jgi:hypothetical protein